MNNEELHQTLVNFQALLILGGRIPDMTTKQANKNAEDFINHTKENNNGPIPN